MDNIKKTFFQQIVEKFGKKVCYTHKEFKEELKKSKKGDIIFFDEVRNFKRGDTNEWIKKYKVGIRIMQPGRVQEPGRSNKSI